MFAVFAAFVPEGDASIQPIALGLAVGVAIDAFIVRMTLIPAVLTLFGRHAWWMPRAVERVLPRFDAEGEGIALELSLAGWPEGEPMAIAAEGVTLTRGGLDLVEGVDVLVPRGGVLLVRSSDREASAAFVAAVCLPWTIYTMKLVTPTMQSAPGWAFVARALPFYIFQLKTATGLLLFSLGLLGILVCFLPAFSSPRPRGLWFSMAALLIADVVFHAVVPAGLEPRYLISATFPVLLFAAEGARWLCRLPLPIVHRPIPVSAAALVFIVLFAAFPFRVTPKYSFGFAQAATDILADPTLAHSAVLCSSDRDGEGLLISEMAMRERRNGHYILRASKMLAVSDWNGSGYRLRLNTSGEINRLLDDLPVDLVVIDETPGVLHYQHNDLLLRAMEDPGWRLANVYPKTAAGMAPRARIEVYRRNGIAARSFDPNRLSFRDLVKSLE